MDPYYSTTYNQVEWPLIMHKGFLQNEITHTKRKRVAWKISAEQIWSEESPRAGEDMSRTRTRSKIKGEERTRFGEGRWRWASREAEAWK